MKLISSNNVKILVLFIMQSLSCQAKLSKKMANILKEAEKPKEAKAKQIISKKGLSPQTSRDYCSGF